MSEKPIIFSQPMVIAILSDKKSQTRRVVTPHTSYIGEGGKWEKLEFNHERTFVDTGFGACQYLHVPYDYEYDETIYRVYPRWRKGDRLWVRESFATEKRFDDKPMSFFDKAAVVPIWFKYDNKTYEEFAERGKWRPSIFMPRWASRITLEVTDVRVQRLQEISHEEIIAEGLGDGYTEIGWNYAFGQLWNKINEKRGYGWSTNPWVWAISFRRIQ